MWRPQPEDFTHLISVFFYPSPSIYLKIPVRLFVQLNWSSFERIDPDYLLRRSSATIRIEHTVCSLMGFLRIFLASFSLGSDCVK